MLFCMFLSVCLCVNVFDAHATDFESSSIIYSRFGSIRQTFCKVDHSFESAANPNYLGYESLRKSEWQNVLTDIAFSYAYKLNIQRLIQDYRDMLRLSFSSVLKNCLANSQNTTRDINSSIFDAFFHSIPGLSEVDGDFSKFNVNSSLGFGSTGLKCSYKLPFGVVSSSWNMEKNDVTLRVRIPLNLAKESSCQVLIIKDILEKSNELLRQNRNVLKSGNTDTQPVVILE